MNETLMPIIKNIPHPDAFRSAIKALVDFPAI